MFDFVEFLSLEPENEMEEKMQEQVRHFLDLAGGSEEKVNDFLLANPGEMVAFAKMWQGEM